jgi:1-aminocyclopropane-1-carboxylate deaminase/D-cysteine desulfhydrase-like pyridoxal-dependent ACC family enzyme
MTIGTYPTAVEHLMALSRPGCDLWVKRDDQTHPRYGGNKVRKLEHILCEARRRGARRIVTLGAAGSHHVLATTIHGRAAGFRVAAVLTQQPCSRHAEDNLRAGLAAGLEASPARSWSAVPLVVGRILERTDYFVPPGGTNAMTSVGYANAVIELSDQIARGELPAPDVMVAALGSGGTVAGLVAGVCASGLPTRVLAVRVVQAPLVTRTSTLLLAHAASRAMGRRPTWRELGEVLEIEDSLLGPGYAWPTTWGQRAIEVGREQGLQLEATYTAKAFAGALRLMEHVAVRRVLYWHTLSSAPMQPLLEGAGELPKELRSLFLEGGQDSGGA